LGDKRTLLKIQFPAQPPKKPREESCILTEGQSDGPIKVLQIDIKSGSVALNNAGTETVITFTKDGPGVAKMPTQAVAPRPLSLRRFIRN